MREFCNETDHVGICDPAVRRYEQERVDEHNAVKRAVLEILEKDSLRAQLKKEEESKCCKCALLVFDGICIEGADFIPLCQSRNCSMFEERKNVR